jgi:hypothetical protein
MPAQQRKPIEQLETKGFIAGVRMIATGVVGLVRAAIKGKVRQWARAHDHGGRRQSGRACRRPKAKPLTGAGQGLLGPIKGGHPHHNRRLHCLLQARLSAFEHFPKRIFRVWLFPHIGGSDDSAHARGRACARADVCRSRRGVPCLCARHMCRHILRDRERARSASRRAVTDAPAWRDASRGETSLARAGAIGCEHPAAAVAETSPRRQGVKLP